MMGFKRIYKEWRNELSKKERKNFFFDPWPLPYASKKNAGKSKREIGILKENIEKLD